MVNLPDKMRTAAEWLMVNNGDNGEAEHCHTVAVWLRTYADKLEMDTHIRVVAREKGLSYGVVRVRLRRQQAKRTPASAETA